MRAWLVLCVLASAALAGVQLMSMRTHRTTWMYKGSLVSVSDVHPEDKPLKSELAYAQDFQQVIKDLREGDSAEFKRTLSRFPLMGKRSLITDTIQRPGSPALIHKYGVAEFYLVFSAITAAPFFLWTGVFLLTRSSPATP